MTAEFQTWPELAFPSLEQEETVISRPDQGIPGANAGKSRRRSRRRAFRTKTGVLLLAGIGLALAGNLCIGVLLAARSWDDGLPAPSLNARVFPVAHAALAAPGGDSSAALGKQGLVALAMKVVSELDAYVLAAETWKAEVEPLLHNDDGRRIASREWKVESFVYIYDSEPLNEQQAKRMRDEAKQHLQTIEDAGVSELQDAAAAARLEELRTNAHQLRSSLEQNRRDIMALVSTDDPLAGDTLHAAVAKVKRRWEMERLVVMWREAGQERKRLAALQAEAERAKLQRERLQQEAQRPRVQNVLAAFTQPSYRLDGVTLPRKRRYSLSYLKEQQALQPTPQGRAKFVWFALRTDLKPNPWRALMKDGKVLAARQWSEEQSRAVRLAQEYLRKYGPALVELGQLHP